MELTSKQALARPAVLPVDLATGDRAYVRSLTYTQRRDFFTFSAGLRDETPIDDLFHYLLRLALSDADGNRLYADGDAVEIADGRVLQDLYEAAAEFNLLTRASQEAEKNG